MSDIDTRVRKILGLLKHAYNSGIPFDAPEEGVDTPELRALMREAAASAVVLLKNETQTLPISSSSLTGKTVAVIGPNAAVAMFSGGGSARLLPTYTVSPLQGITTAAEQAGAKVVYARGASTAKFLPTLDRAFDKSGARMEFWNAEPAEKWLSATETPVPAASKAVWTTHTASADTFLADGVEDKIVEEICWISYKVSFVADESGEWELVSLSLVLVTLTLMESFSLTSPLLRNAATRSSGLAPLTLVHGYHTLRRVRHMSWRSGRATRFLLWVVRLSLAVEASA
jgi:beta-glucosidase